MLVQQTARYLHQQKKASILLKLDITKAFDSVSWPFVLEVMKNLGFGQIWCDIISGLLSSSETQVLTMVLLRKNFIPKRAEARGPFVSNDIYTRYGCPWVYVQKGFGREPFRTSC
jgi:hypothetical protein